jgi:hypothetical protein
MKFFLSEKNLGTESTREQALAVIDMLVQKGWDVAYGERANELTDPSEQGQTEQIMDAFTEDFLLCLEKVESQPDR